VPIQVTCRSCHGTFNAPDSAAGKRAKCPKCGNVIEIPSAVPAEEIYEAEESPPQPSDDEEFEVEPPPTVSAEDRKPCPTCGEMIARAAVKCRFCGEVLDKSMMRVLGDAGDVRDPAWQKVRSGLATLYYCTMVIVVAMIVLAVGSVIVGAGAGGGPNDAPPAVLFVMMGLVGLVILGAAIGALVGQVRCTKVPENSGARGFANGAVICTVANVLAAVVGTAVNVQAIASIGNLLAVIGSVLFILFIRRSAAYLGNNDLSASAGTFLFFGASVVVGAFMLGMVAMILKIPAILGIVGLAAIAGLVSFVWYLRLIKSLMDTIDQRLAAM
jgi:predicted RNA-binding Zn-ribbon protein involved in translation (DUF1610 family)